MPQRGLALLLALVIVFVYGRVSAAAERHRVCAACGPSLHRAEGGGIRMPDCRSAGSTRSVGECSHVADTRPASRHRTMLWGDKPPAGRSRAKGEFLKDLLESAVSCGGGSSRVDFELPGWCLDHRRDLGP